MNRCLNAFAVHATIATNFVIRGLGMSVKSVGKIVKIRTLKTIMTTTVDMYCGCLWTGHPAGFLLVRWQIGCVGVTACRGSRGLYEYFI